MEMRGWLKWVLLAGVFVIPFVPFIISTSMFFPFITGKNFTFRIIIELLAGGLAILALVDPDYRPRFSWITVAILSLFAVGALSTVFSVDALKSFWSNFERMEGLVGFMHLVLWFFIAGILLNTEKLWTRFLQVSIGAAVIMGIYAMVQLSGFLTINQGGIRLDGTLGNAIYMAVYMLFHIFLTLFLFFKHIRTAMIDRVQATYDVWVGVALAVPVGAVVIGTPFLLKGMFTSFEEAKGWVIAYGIVIGGAFLATAGYGIYRNSTKIISMYYSVALAMSTIALYYTATRSATLGLLGGLVVMALGIALFGRDSKGLRKVAFGVIAAVIVVVGVFVAIRDQAWVQHNPVLTRFASLSLSENTVGSRLMIWNMARQGVVEHPLLGWGFENFSYVFNKYYDPRMWGQEQWFDRAHNAYIDWAIAAGIPGFLLFISLFVLALWFIIKADSLSVPEKSALVGLVAAYGFHSIFVFDNLISSIYFFLLLALVHGLSKRQLPSSMALTKPVVGAPLMLSSGALVITTIAALYCLNVPGIATAHSLIDAISATKQSVDATGKLTTVQKTPLENLAAFDSATSRSSLGRQEAVEQLLQAAVTATNTSGVPADIRDKFVALAKDRGEKLLISRPDDARLELFYGSFLSQAGDLQNGVAHLKKAHELSPKKQTILFELGINVYMRAGDVNDAIATVKEGYDLAPEYPEAGVYYAIVLLFAGQPSGADAALARTFGTPIVDDQRILRAYSEVKRFDRVVEILKARKPSGDAQTDAQTMVSLAAAYKDAGDTGMAAETLREAIQTFPQFKAEIAQIASQFGLTL